MNSFRFYWNSTIAISLALLMFHLLILWAIIPYTIIWGGRINSKEQMVQVESLSIILIIIFLIVLVLKRKLNKGIIFNYLVNILLGVFAIYFFINALLNLKAISLLEKLLFTPIALLLSIYIAKILWLTKKNQTF